MSRRDDILQAISELVVPLVHADGGTVELVSFDDASVTLKMGGACAGCPGQQFTKAHVLEPVLGRALGTSVVVKILNSA